MEAAAIQQKGQVAPTMARPPKHISWEEFQRKYLTREDSYKYEWVGCRISSCQ